MLKLLLIIFFFIIQQFFIIKGQSEWEKIFLNLPNSQIISDHLKFYTSMPHVAGTEEDFLTAEYTNSKFLEFGLESKINTQNVLLTYPKNRIVEMLHPIKFTCSLQEAVIPEDPSTENPKIIPTFNGYSPSGDVTAELVYINYGSLEDFMEIEKMGINLKGKIGIVRYGHLFRGTKAMIAQKYGMIGLLIYSDPIDDGYLKGPVFPNGPWRPESGVQRGSVQFLSICPGDPRRKVCSSNPNYNYTQGIPNIPVQPLSWGDAYPLLKSLEGKIAPNHFQGGLNFTYHIGPGPTVVHLKLEIEFKISQIWNVIATIPGEEKDKTVILGNHRDAWVFGAADPNSGTATLLEIARSFGIMLKEGWRPKRNIILASWDGEEYGLLGSTAWVEENSIMLSKNAIAYLNVDVAVTGTNFGISATPSLTNIFREIANQIIDPKSKKPLSEIWDGSVRTLGSGSDYTSFIDHYGIASADFGFYGSYGVYHSTYDDYYWMSHFGDPTFEYHIACAQVWGLAVLKIVDMNILPFNYTSYGEKLNEYFIQIQKKLKEKGHSMNLTKLEEAISFFKQVSSDIKVDTSLNDRLIFTERKFINSKGIPKRPYYRHVIQAPGLYEGYASSVFPGLAQSINEQNWSEAEEQYEILYQSIYNAANYLAGNS
jgi:N-acetylated-alpha-linked acidic dipeptidase